MGTVRNIAQSVLPESLKQATMAPSGDTSFAAHTAARFASYEKDRQTKSQQTLTLPGMVRNPRCSNLHLTCYFSNGVPMPHPYETQRAGENGPLLLQDYHLIDLLSHFDRERIPERVVHAKGAGAYGEFEVTDSVADLTSIDMLSEVGKKTKCIARFSTVGGEKGWV